MTLSPCYNFPVFHTPHLNQVIFTSSQDKLCISTVMSIKDSSQPHCICKHLTTRMTLIMLKWIEGQDNSIVIHHNIVSQCTTTIFLKTNARINFALLLSWLRRRKVSPLPHPTQKKKEKKPFLRKNQGGWTEALPACPNG